MSLLSVGKPQTRATQSLCFNNGRTPAATVAVRSNAIVVDSLFIVAANFCEGFVFGPCFVML